MEPETLTLVREEGTSFTVTLRTASRPGAPLVLVLPAMGMRARYYGRLVEALHAAGCHAAVCELRGHEETGGRRPGWRYDFGYADLVDDAGRALAALRSRLDGAPAYVLGHSLGGQVATAYAAVRAGTPAAPDGLVLVAAGTVHWRLWGWRLLVRTQVAAALGQVVGHYPGERVGFGGREARTQIADWARLGRTGRLRLGRQGPDATAAAAALRLPVLAVSFAGDALAPAASTDGLVGWMPRAELTRVHLDPAADGVEGIDHVRWARRPEVVVPTVRAWLDER